MKGKSAARWQARGVASPVHAPPGTTGDREHSSPAVGVGIRMTEPTPDEIEALATAYGLSKEDAADLAKELLAKSGPRLTAEDLIELIGRLSGKTPEQVRTLFRQALEETRTIERT